MTHGDYAASTERPPILGHACPPRKWPRPTRAGRGDQAVGQPFSTLPQLSVSPAARLAAGLGPLCQRHQHGAGERVYLCVCHPIVGRGMESSNGMDGGGEPLQLFAPHWPGSSCYAIVGEEERDKSHRGRCLRSWADEVGRGGQDERRSGRSVGRTFTCNSRELMRARASRGQQPEMRHGSSVSCVLIKTDAQRKDDIRSRHPTMQRVCFPRTVSRAVWPYDAGVSHHTLDPLLVTGGVFECLSCPRPVPPISRLGRAAR